MILHPPMIITARLMAGVALCGVTISIDKSGATNRDGKPEWFYAIDSDSDAWDERIGEGSDLWGWDDHRGMLSTLLNFLSACAESRASGKGSENSDLFPEAIGAWAEENSDEIGMLACELGEQGE